MNLTQVAERIAGIIGLSGECAAIDQIESILREVVEEAQTKVLEQNEVLVQVRLKAKEADVYRICEEKLIFTSCMCIDRIRAKAAEEKA